MWATSFFLPEEEFPATSTPIVGPNTSFLVDRMDVEYQETYERANLLATLEYTLMSKPEVQASRFRHSALL